MLCIWLPVGFLYIFVGFLYIFVGGMEICRIETWWHLAACWISRQRNGIPMFPPRWIYAPRIKPKATSRDSSGQAGLAGRQVRFLSKRGGSVATPTHPYLLPDLNEGTTNREMAQSL